MTAAAGNGQWQDAQRIFRQASGVEKCICLVPPVTEAVFGSGDTTRAFGSGEGDGSNAGGSLELMIRNVASWAQQEKTARS
jgi:hypothetical protein